VLYVVPRNSETFIAATNGMMSSYNVLALITGVKHHFRTFLVLEFYIERCPSLCYLQNVATDDFEDRTDSMSICSGTKMP